MCKLLCGYRFLKRTALLALSECLSFSHILASQCKFIDVFQLPRQQQCFILQLQKQYLYDTLSILLVLFNHVCTVGITCTSQTPQLSAELLAMYVYK